MEDSLPTRVVDPTINHHSRKKSKEIQSGWQLFRLRRHTSASPPLITEQNSDSSATVGRLLHTVRPRCAREALIWVGPKTQRRRAATQGRRYRLRKATDRRYTSSLVRGSKRRGWSASS